MERRTFIQQSSFVGLTGLMAVTPFGCTPSAERPNEAATAQTANQDFILNEVTISQLQDWLKDGTYTSRQLVALYLERIANMDKSGPAINAIIELNPDALSIADELDAERQSGKMRGPMHGIPILIKDNIDTADKMSTTAGSLALEGHIAREDAFIVQQLRAAGAILLGKTNLSEWANFRSSRSSSGWSSRGGQTKNPCVLSRNPCGSSSGSAAAVAANFCAVAVGTETDGSVTAPASFCGIVGLKPTVGLLSRTGIIPISATQDTAGPMTRTVQDTAILLQAMTGIDPADAATAASNGKVPVDYSASLSTDALKGKRIGVEQSQLEGHEGVTALYKAAIEKLEELGATIVPVQLLEACASGGAAEYAVLQYEFKAGLNKYLGQAGSKVRSLADVIAFNKANETSVMPYFQQEILESSQDMGSLEDKAYRDAVKTSQEGTRNIIDELMQSEKLDAIIGITIGPANLTDLVHGDYHTGYYFCQPAARAGYPHITVPMGKVQELPVGLSIMASAFQEGALLGMAFAYEQATQHRAVPKFL